MSNHDYYWELNIEKGAFQAIGPKRTLEFFLEAVKKGRQHILDLYNPHRIIFDRSQVKKALKVMKTFKLNDNELELALARILVKFSRIDENNRKELATIYLPDLIGKNIILDTNVNDELTKRILEYASFRASADYITVTYGIYSRPELELARAEAEILKNKFLQDRRGIHVKQRLRTARESYEHAFGTAEQILSEDFFRLTDSDKRNWENRARLNEKLYQDYGKCLEILRTARCKFFH